MSRTVDALIVYRILRLFATPIEEMDAYKLGIIDANGKKIKDPNYLTSALVNFSYIILIIPVVLLKENALLCRYWFFLLIILYLFFYFRLYSFSKK